MSQKLIFKQLLIVDIGERKAKSVEFAGGKNLLTSSSNHLGKSLICKSLYHALGADALFSDKWKRTNAVYLLQFMINDKEYYISRKDTALKKGSVFNLYDSKWNKIKFYKIKNLLHQLNQLFDFNIRLVRKNDSKVVGEMKSFEDSYPVYMYTPYYIDQENGWTPLTESFANLRMVDSDQRKAALYYHLGCLDNEYIELELSSRQAQDQRNIKSQELEQCRQIIAYMQKFIDDNGNVVTNEEELNQKIISNKTDINTLLKLLEKLRNEIIGLENDKAIAQKEKETISLFLRKESRRDIETTTVECPKCEYTFSVDFKERFRKEYLIETINEDLSRVIDIIAKCEEKIESKNKEYVDTRNKLKLLERSIVSDQDLYNAYIKIKSARSMIADNTMKIGQLELEIKSLTDMIKSLWAKLKVFDVRMKEADAIYKNQLGLLFSRLKVNEQELQPESYSVGGQISVSGAYKERAILAKYYAFLQTKKYMADGIIKFPLVIDSPKGNEQDKINAQTIMDFVLNGDELDNQVIVATIDGKDYLDKHAKVNVIELSNEEGSLLSRTCYLENEKFITKILLDFGD